MLWNVLIVKLAKLYTVNLYVSLSALYMLQYVPIVIILVIVYLFKKKRKMTRTSVWVKIPKLCHNTLLSIFSLGKGRESLHLKTLHKNLLQVHFLTFPQHKMISKVSVMHVKITQNMYIFHANFAPFQ